MKVSHSRYLAAVFELVEYVIKNELTNTSRNLIEHYLNDSSEDTMAGKARDAVMRYTQADVPTLQQIRTKSKTQELDNMDHLVLKMEYESKRYFDR
jgi:hypothetical protein